MKTYSYILTVSLLSVGFIVMCGWLGSIVHYEYKCINGILMERINDGMWISNTEYPTNCASGGEKQ